MDPTGKFLGKGVIYPTNSSNYSAMDEETILNLINKHGVDLIVIGNGTGSRESSQFIAHLIKKYNSALGPAGLNLQYMVVSEA